MGDRSRMLRITAICVAGIAGATMAAAVASAQGPGDYEPPPTTPGGPGGTTTLPAPGDGQLAFRASATGAEKLGAFVKVNVYCDEACSAESHGRLRLTRIKTADGKDSESFKLGRDGGQVTDGHEQLMLKVPKRARKLAPRTKPHGGRIRAKITVTAADAAGNVGLERLRLNFRDPR